MTVTATAHPMKHSITSTLAEGGPLAGEWEKPEAGRDTRRLLDKNWFF